MHAGTLHPLADLPVSTIRENIAGQGGTEHHALAVFPGVDRHHRRHGARRPESRHRGVSTTGVARLERGEALLTKLDYPIQTVSFGNTLSMVFLGLIVLNGWLKFQINTMKGWMGERMLRRLRYALYDTILRFPLTRFRRVKAAEMATMIKDEVEPLGGFIGEALITPLFLGGQALTAMFFILYQHWVLGLIALAVVAVQAVVIPKLRQRLLVLGRERQLTARALAGRIAETVDGAAEIHANATSNYERAEISARLGRIFKIRFEFYQRKFLIKFLNNFLSQVTPFLFYNVGGYLVIVDESHVTIPQIGGMYKGDRSRKENLVDYGFRLPSALDNRPLRFDEFRKIMPQTVFVSATPAEFERVHSGQVVEQVVRPTGLVDPQIEVRPATTQVDDLMSEVSLRTVKGERVLVTTLTKRMAEDLTDYFSDHGIKVRYLHSDIDTVERVEIIRDLRLGKFDVLVGINLLREGLDIPEVSLVAILDADKEGFLRSERSLIQTIGRAARHINGTALLYADRITNSMRLAMDETERRRNKQILFNQEHGITPRSVHKRVKDLIDGVYSIETAQQQLKAAQVQARYDSMSEVQLAKEIKVLEKQMLDAAKNLEFEKAAEYRDELKKLKNKLFVGFVEPESGKGPEKALKPQKTRRAIK